MEKKEKGKEVHRALSSVCVMIGNISSDLFFSGSKHFVIYVHFKARHKGLGGSSTLRRTSELQTNHRLMKKRQG